MAVFTLRERTLPRQSSSTRSATANTYYTTTAYGQPQHDVSAKAVGNKTNLAVLCSLGLFGLAVAISTNTVFWLHSINSSRASETTRNLAAETDHVWLQDYKSHIPARSLSGDEKFLLMDYSPWLGFNNMRYMIERGLYLAALLNRTLALPTHLRIRQCSDVTLCQQIAAPLDPTTMGRNEQGSTMALDLGYFFDLSHLDSRTHGSIIDFRTLMEEVVGMPKGAALIDSQFGAQVSHWLNQLTHQEKHKFASVDDVDEMETYAALEYQDEEKAFDEMVLNSQDSQPSLIRRLRRSRWDLKERDGYSYVDDLIRNVLVDDFEGPGQTDKDHIQLQGDGTFKIRRRFYAFGDVRGGGLDRIVQWSLDFAHDPQSDNADKGIPQLDAESCRPPVENPDVGQIPWEARFPAFATCRIENYVGLKQELAPVQERMLSIEGQFHTTGWMPLAFSSFQNAQTYRSKAITFLRYSPAVYEAAEYLTAILEETIRMRQGWKWTARKTDTHGSPRLLLSMHVRRGDFVTDGYGWQDHGEAWLKTVVKEAAEDVLGPLSKTRGFYLATDESSPRLLDYFHSLGAILFEDLIDARFEQRFASLLAVDDWIGLVEQVICAQAKMFYGTMTSSFTSGIINMKLNLEEGQHDGGEPNFRYLMKPGGPSLAQ
ncbi:unnamed protein product [Mortierella alpina]